MKLLNGIRKSFTDAWHGVLLAFRSERSFRLQVGAGLVVIALCGMLPLKDWERAMLLLATGSVLVLELLNSMVERLVDLVKPRLHQYVREIKDLMAAVVLIASLFAGAIGLLIVWPYMIQLVERV